MSDKSTYSTIVDAADQLFYKQGFEFTSFSDIANVVGISRGNFYYHFKTKDEILSAVIELRLEKTRKMLEKWEHEGETPLGRIRCFVGILIANRTKIMKYGCPVGTLCAELAKLDHPSLHRANEVFELFRIWLRDQFVQMGAEKEADAFAMHVLARSQGIATLASAFRDKSFVDREVEELNEWLETLSTRLPREIH